MKKFVLLLLAVMMMITVSGAVFAQSSVPPSPSFNGNGEVTDVTAERETKVWIMKANSYQLTTLARAWISSLNGTDENKANNGNSSDPFSNYYYGCNKFSWPVNLYMTASVAQWIQYSVCNNEWDWLVKKPGKYVAEPICLKVKSNGDVNVAVSMNPLTYYQPPTGANYPDIPVALSVSKTLLTSNDDYTAAGGPADSTFTGDSKGAVLDWTIKYDDMKKTDSGKTLDNLQTVQSYIWPRITVNESTHACCYLGSGTITLSPVTQKYWIDGIEGGWKEGATPYYNPDVAHPTPTPNP